MEAKKFEQVGNVILNLDYYSGNDYYSEGEAEDVLLDIVKKYSPHEYEHVIENSRSWNVLYHLSHIRENIVTWLPITKKDKILEIGAGCGALTGSFANLGGYVTCIELSKKRSLINATRHLEYNNIEIIVGNFEDIEQNITEKFDYISLVGVLEYAESYIHAENPYVSFIESVKKHLAPDGKIVIATENKYGLKYFAGCKEDHTGKYFEGIEGYPSTKGVKTFSMESLNAIFNQCNLKYKYFYPYPDYKLPHSIFSDEKLPSEGELNTNLRNFDHDRIVLFDEAKVFDEIIREGLFKFYSNSYVIILSEEELEKTYTHIPMYSKFANERTPEFREGTFLCRTPEGEIQVYKTATDSRCNAHIKRIYDNYLTLCRQYENTIFKTNVCRYIPGREPVPLVAGATSKALDTVRLEYLDGINMEEYLIKLYFDKKFDEIEALIRKYIDSFCALHTGEYFRETERFNRIFGERKFESNYTGGEKSSFDLIFSNIVFDKNDGPDGAWNILDYEWCFDFPVPDKFLVFRGLYYFFEFTLPQLKEHYLSAGKDIYEVFGYTKDEVSVFTNMEHNFQIYVIGGNASLEVMHTIMPTNTVFLENALRESDSLKNLNTPKLYYSYGEGYSDERRILVIANVDGPEVTMDIPLKSNMRGIRIDPTEYDSIVSVREIYTTDDNNNRTDITRFMMNGYMIDDKTVVFNTDDGQIIIEDIPRNARILHVRYQVSMFLPEIYEGVKNMAKREQEKLYERTFREKALMKLHLMKRPKPLPEGFHYNVKA